MHNIATYSENLIISIIATIIFILIFSVIINLAIFIYYLVKKHKKECKKMFLSSNCVLLIMTIIILFMPVIDLVNKSYVEIDNVIEIQKCSGSTKQLFSNFEYKFITDNNEIYYGYDFVSETMNLSEIDYPCNVVIAKNSRFILLIE